MRRFILKVVIEEGNNEFWEELEGTGADTILDIVSSLMEGEFNDDVEVRLVKYAMVE